MKIMDTFKGKVRLVVKNNPYKYRDYSHIAAEASLAAADQGKYWEMHDLLLKNSPKLDRNSLINYAKELGLDVNRFTDSIDKMRHSALIEQDKKLALSLDLFNTPTFFINGRKVVGDVPYEHLKKVIEEELKHANK
ncbi:MAG: disulfide bond formation protein [Nitrospirae bacterium]|jgi:protein-disulfide isomerase|nr:disulfide bond formation protein [Nitrospirota bacterium]